MKQAALRKNSFTRAVRIYGEFVMQFAIHNIWKTAARNYE